MRKLLTFISLLFFAQMMWAGSDKVTICHNQNHNPVTIEVDDASMLPAHLSHGDTIGPCVVDPPPPPPPPPPDDNCPSGQVKDANGNCVVSPPPDPPDNDCPNGQVKDANGNCVVPPPPPPPPPPDDNCPNGQVKDANGNCVVPPPPDPPNPPDPPVTPVEPAKKPRVVSFTIDPNFVLTCDTGSRIAFRIVYILEDDTAVADRFLFPFKAVISKATVEKPQLACLANTCYVTSEQNGYVAVAVTMLGKTKTVAVNFLPLRPASSGLPDPLLIVPSFSQGNPGEVLTARVNLPRALQQSHASKLPYFLTVEYGRNLRRSLFFQLSDLSQGGQVNVFNQAITGLSEDGPMQLKATLQDPLGVKIAEGSGPLWAKFGDIVLRAEVRRNASDPAKLEELVVQTADNPDVSWQELTLLIGGKFFLTLPVVQQDDNTVVYAGNRGYASLLMGNYWYDVALIGKNASGAPVTRVQPKALWLPQDLIVE